MILRRHIQRPVMKEQDGQLVHAVLPLIGFTSGWYNHLPVRVADTKDAAEAPPLQRVLVERCPRFVWLLAGRNGRRHPAPPLLGMMANIPLLGPRAVGSAGTSQFSPGLRFTKDIFPEKLEQKSDVQIVKPPPGQLNLYQLG